MLKKVGAGVAAASTMLLLAGQAQADALISTDRFGYTGTVTRYATEADARAGTNALDAVTIGNRDASIYISDNENIVMGSWWYTTQGSAGWGNVNGNTGMGFMQLYDSNASTDTAKAMGFQNLAGGVWTQFHTHVEGSNATAAADAARFSAYSNTGDAGTYLDYMIDVTAYGLEGTEAGGVITATDHPDAVSGTFTGLFVFGGDPDGYPAGAGPAGWVTSYYVINLAFDMTNWAYSQNGNLNGLYQENGNIYSSMFQGGVLPEPATLALLGFGLAGLGFIRRRRAA